MVYIINTLPTYANFLSKNNEFYHMLITSPLIAPNLTLIATQSFSISLFLSKFETNFFFYIETKGKFFL